jgi:Ca-activated chloride channel family protein
MLPQRRGRILLDLPVPRRKGLPVLPGSLTSVGRSFRHFLLAFSVVLALCAPVCYPESSQAKSPVLGSVAQKMISVSSSLVILPVRVTDADGVFVSGLNMQDFRVYDNGELRTITAFRHDDAPATVGMIVDHSRSMGASLPEIAVSVTAFAQSSNPRDEMFVVNFNDTASLEPLGGKPFSSNPKELGKAVSSVSARGRTALYDAVALGLRQLQLGRWEKKALIVVSDGEDNASRLKYSQLLTLAEQSSALIYSVALQESPNEEENTEVLKGLSKKTGGAFYAPASVQDVAKVTTDIARDIRKEYTLGFVPVTTERSDSFRKLQVKVNAPGRGKLHVQTRAGYARAAEGQSGVPAANSAS